MLVGKKETQKAQGHVQQGKKFTFGELRTLTLQKIALL